MPQLLHLTIHSARFVLWPAIILNTGVVAFAAGASVLASLLLSVALACVASFGFIINDCADVEVDLVNQVGRLEAATERDRRTVGIFGTFLLCLGLLISILVSMLAFATMTIIALSLLAYTHLARKRLVVATILASVLSSAPLWLANIVLDVKFTPLQIILIVAVFIFLMARELIFDVQDRLGDQHGGRQTFATVFGARTAISISFALHIVGSVLLLFVSVRGMEATKWWPVIVANVTLFLILILPVAWSLRSRNASAHTFARFTLCSRAAMLLIPIIWLAA